MLVRRYKINVTCAACELQLNEVFKNFSNFKYSLNVMEGILKITSDPKIYSDQLIYKTIKLAGYEAIKI